MLLGFDWAGLVHCASLGVFEAALWGGFGSFCVLGGLGYEGMQLELGGQGAALVRAWVGTAALLGRRWRVASIVLARPHGLHWLALLRRLVGLGQV